MKKIYPFLIAFILGGIFFISCEKDEDPGAPELPPAEALTIDFSDFSNPTDTLNNKKSSALTGVSYKNWGTAFLNVAFWNSFITTTMVVPVASYLEAFNHDPEYLGDNKWQWTYDYAVKNAEYSAKLVAYRISNEEFKAEMYISRSGGFTDFLWFEGTIKYNRTHASWIMYESPVNNVKLLSIEWNRDWEAESGDITYTMIKEGAIEENSYINFSRDPLADPVSSYTVQTSDNKVVIEWDPETKAGHISDQKVFGDTIWHCWNENLQDIICQ